MAVRVLQTVTVRTLSVTEVLRHALRPAAGSGDSETVTRWAVGEVLDTIRSRRGGLIETRAYAPIP